MEGRVKCLLFIALAAFLSSCGTSRPFVGEVGRVAAVTGLSFASGASWGLHEATAHHWEKFHATFPGADPRYWDPKESWKNKYVARDPSLGRNRVPLVFTDAKHLLASANQGFIFGAGLTVTIGERSGWKVYATRVAGSAVGYYLGHKTTFDWIYK